MASSLPSPDPPDGSSAWMADALAPPALAPAASVAAVHAVPSDAYAAAALAREVERVAQATEGTRNATLNEAAYNLGQLVGSGALAAGVVEDALTSAALAAGLGEREARRTIGSGLSAGRSQPRQVPERRLPTTGGAPALEPAAAPWPELGAAALHGLAGEVVGALDLHTESDPVALLLSLLVGFGSLVGPGPHAYADGCEHPARLNAVLVGDTAKARKGTSWANVRRVLEAADRVWAEQRVMGGLASGEGLIAAVRDEPGPDGEPVETDRRLLVVEPEYAKVLQVAAREGNTLSTVLREAFDSGRLRVMTRKDPLVTTGAHVSVLGHVTTEELRRRLSDTEAANGFANRYLFACVRRSKLLPDGGSLPAAEVAELGRRLGRAASTARTRGRLERTPDAAVRWRELYAAFDDRPGLLGAITARPEAQTLRLSVAYALLDEAATVDIAHLEAAHAVWRYCEASALRVFGDAVGDPVADRILDRLRLAGDALTRDEVRKLFSGHESAQRLDGVLATLADAGRIVSEQRTTGGRPATVYRAISAESAERSPQ